MVLLIKQNISAMISGLSWEPNHKVGPNFNENVQRSQQPIYTPTVRIQAIWKAKEAHSQ